MADFVVKQCWCVDVVVVSQYDQLYYWNDPLTLVVGEEVVHHLPSVAVEEVEFVGLASSL